MAGSVQLKYIGNDPLVLLRHTLSHMLQMKAICLGCGVVVGLLAVYQHQYNLYIWRGAASQQDHTISTNQTFAFGFTRPTFSFDKPLENSLWWVMYLQFGLGSAITGVALTHFLFLLITNFRVARWDRLFYMVASGILPTMLVSLIFTYLFARADEQESEALGFPYLICIFFIQILPTIVGPSIQRPILSDIMISPVKMGLLSVVLTAAVALVVLDTLTPAYAEASTTTRVFIRVVVFPLLIEIPAGAVRVASRYWLKPDFPMSRLIIFLMSPIVLSSMVGRFLTTNMNSLTNTIAVAVLLSFVEVFMRSTMLWRDDLYTRCCGRPCGGRAGKKKHQRAEAHSWVMFMLFETMVEDVSILLSLPVTLLMRIPPLPGGEPLSTGDVVVRVLIQYVIETLTDVGFALGYYVMTACCGVRYNAVSLSTMETRFNSTLIRRDEQHRYLFVPLPLRKLARRISSMSTSSPSRARTPSRVNSGVGKLTPSAGRMANSSPTAKRNLSPSHKSPMRPPSNQTEDAPGDTLSSPGTLSAPFTHDPPSLSRSQSAGIASPPAVERKTVASISEVERSDKPPLAPSVHVHVPVRRALSGSAAPAASVASTPKDLLDDTPTHALTEAYTADDAQLAFCSCTPCCFSAHHPLARRTRQELKQELKREVRWEREFLWQPMPIGLVAYQASRGTVCLQSPPWRSASPTRPPSELDPPAVATGSPSTDAPAPLSIPPPVVLNSEPAAELEPSVRVSSMERGGAEGTALASRLASDISDASGPSSAGPIRLSSYDQAEAVRFASDGQPPSSTAYEQALRGHSGAGVSPVMRPSSHSSKTSDAHTQASDMRYNTQEQALAFDQLIAAQNGTEVDASLDEGYEPTTAQVATMRIEIVALMFLRGWETRFKNFNWMLFGGTVAGAIYVLRTFIGALCPFGDPNDESTWKFDFCS